jgi:hypothetical protein
MSRPTPVPNSPGLLNSPGESLFAPLERRGCGFATSGKSHIGGKNMAQGDRKKGRENRKPKQTGKIETKSSYQLRQIEPTAASIKLKKE